MKRSEIIYTTSDNFIAFFTKNVLPAPKFPLSATTSPGERTSANSFAKLTDSSIEDTSFKYGNIT